MIHAVEAEASLIGSVMYDVSACEEAIDRLRPEHFFDPVMSMLWGACRSLALKGLVDPVSLNAMVADHKGYQQAGGMSLLADLVDKAALWTVPAHVDLVLDRSQRRLILGLTDAIQKDAFDLSGQTAEDVLARLEAGAGEIARDSSTKEAWKPLSFVAQDAITTARERKGMPGLPIGLSEVDRITGGLRRGQLTLLAGRPGMGKSSAALSVAKAIAGQGRGVAFFSLEMTEPELGLRMACDVAFDPNEIQYSGRDTNPSYSKAEWGALDDRQWARLSEAQSVMSGWPLMFDCRPALTAAQISAAARRITRNWRKSGVEPGCIVVDHLGLIRPTKNGNGNKVQEIAEISGALREMAKALDIPVIALCQLSRDVEKRDGKDRRPNLSDLRWAGELEQDAHVVIFLYRPEYYLKAPEPTGNQDDDDLALARHMGRLSAVQNRLHWIVAKNRQGPTAEAETYCRIECSAIRDLPRAA